MGIDLVIQYLPELLKASLTTLALVLSCIALGFILASLFTHCLESTSSFNYILSYPLRALIFFVRGTPILVQLFLIYFGLAQLEWLRDSVLWILFKQPFFCAMLALSINTACYTTVIFRSALHAIPHGENDAAIAYGFKPWQQYLYLIYPRLLRISLPAYSNEVIMILKSTSLASTITLLELMGMTQKIIGETYANLTFFIAAGIIYLIMNALVSISFKFLEKRYLVYLSGS